MRGLASYLLAGILVVLVLDFVAPPAGLGLAVGATPPVGYAAPTQIVDRTHKGDRLVLPTEVGKTADAGSIAEGDGRLRSGL